MPTYYALYINGTIKAVFSTMHDFHKWVVVIYKPMYHDCKTFRVSVQKLTDVKEDSNYSIYLLVTEFPDNITHRFFSTTDQLEAATKENKKKKVKKMLGIRIVIGYPYTDPLKEGVIFRYPAESWFVNRL